MLDINAKKLCFSILLSVMFFAARSQQADTIKQSDSSLSPFVRSMQKFGSEEAVRSIEKFKEEQISKKQRQLIDLIAKTNQQLSLYIKKGIDTTRIKDELEETRTSLEIVKDGVSRWAP